MTIIREGAALAELIVQDASSEELATADKGASGEQAASSAAETSSDEGEAIEHDHNST
jgi:hypothetical protein